VWLRSSDDSPCLRREVQHDDWLATSKDRDWDFALEEAIVGARYKVTINEPHGASHYAFLLFHYGSLGEALMVIEPLQTQAAVQEENMLVSLSCM